MTPYLTLYPILACIRTTAEESGTSLAPALLMPAEFPRRPLLDVDLVRLECDLWICGNGAAEVIES